MRNPNGIVFYPLLLLCLIVLGWTEWVRAGDLEIADSFWTERYAAPASGGTQSYRRVEADREDASALFAVTLVNRSKQEITSIRGTLSLPKGIQHADTKSSTPTVFYTGVVRFGESFTLLFPLRIDASFDNKAYRCPLSIEYSPVTQSKTVSEKLEATLAMTGRVRIEATGVGGVIAGAASSMRIKLTNNGSARATDLRFSFSHGGMGVANTVSPAIAIVGPRDFELKILEPKSSAEIDLQVFTSNQSAGALLSLNGTLRYGNGSGENVQVEYPIGVVVASQASPMWELSHESGPSKLKAGEVTEFLVSIVNKSGRQLPAASVSFSTPPNTVKLIGESTRTIPSLDPDKSFEVTLTAFATKDLVGRAIPYTWTFEFDESGIPRTISGDQSLLVDGDIQISIQNATVSFVGDQPNLTGSLLNEGNTSALFSSLRLVDSEAVAAGSSASLYLGDLVENSPLPFSIPLQSEWVSRGGTKDLALQITYKNSLREAVTRELFASVQLPSVPEKDLPKELSKEEWKLSPMTLGFIVGIFSGMGLGWLLFRRKRNADLYGALQKLKHEEGASLVDSLERAPNLGKHE